MTMKRKTPSMILAVIGSLWLAMPAYALLRDGCKEDVKKFCPGMKHGDSSLRACMEKHESQLSAACKKNMADIKMNFKKKYKGFAETREACKQDLTQFCANVKPGEGREFACLRAYDDKISAGCKAKLPKRRVGATTRK